MEGLSIVERGFESLKGQIKIERDISSLLSWFALGGKVGGFAQEKACFL